MAIAIVVTGAETWARPREYTLLDLVEQAPLIVEGRVSSKTADAGSVTIHTIVKGHTELAEIQLTDIPEQIPDTPGLRLSPGEDVLLFLATPAKFFTSDHQSKLSLLGSNRLIELVQFYLLGARNDGNSATDATQRFLGATKDYHVLSTLERRFLLQVIARRAVDAPAATVEELVDRAMADTTPDVRWEGFVAARRLALVLERKSEFLSGLRDPDRRVRAIAFDALREKANATFGYDPDLPPERQTKALADWHSWGARN